VSHTAATPCTQVAYIKSHCGYDEAFNYKSEKWGDALQKYCPNGIDV
jgi:NADPH-dependent curcumin reductase CurA